MVKNIQDMSKKQCKNCKWWGIGHCFHSAIYDKGNAPKSAEECFYYQRKRLRDSLGETIETIQLESFCLLWLIAIFIDRKLGLDKY